MERNQLVLLLLPLALLLLAPTTKGNTVNSTMADNTTMNNNTVDNSTMSMNSTMPTDNTTMPMDNSTMSENSTMLPTDYTTMPMDNSTMSENSTMLPTDYTTMPMDNSTMSENSTMLPTDYTTMPMDNSTMSMEHTTMPMTTNSTIVNATDSPMSSNGTVMSTDTTTDSPSNDTTTPISSMANDTVTTTDSPDNETATSSPSMDNDTATPTDDPDESTVTSTVSMDNGTATPTDDDDDDTTVRPTAEMLPKPSVAKMYRVVNLTFDQNLNDTVSFRGYLETTLAEYLNAIVKLMDLRANYVDLKITTNGTDQDSVERLRNASASFAEKLAAGPVVILLGGTNYTLINQTFELLPLAPPPPGVNASYPFSFYVSGDISEYNATQMGDLKMMIAKELARHGNMKDFAERFVVVQVKQARQGAFSVSVRLDRLNGDPAFKDRLDFIRAAVDRAEFVVQIDDDKKKSKKNTFVKSLVPLATPAPPFVDPNPKQVNFTFTIDVNATEAGLDNQTIREEFKEDLEEYLAKRLNLDDDDVEVVLNFGAATVTATVMLTAKGTEETDAAALDTAVAAFLASLSAGKADLKIGDRNFTAPAQNSTVREIPVPVNKSFPIDFRVPGNLADLNATQRAELIRACEDTIKAKLGGLKDENIGDTILYNGSIGVRTSILQLNNEPDLTESYNGFVDDVNNGAIQINSGGVVYQSIKDSFAQTTTEPTTSSATATQPPTQQPTIAATKAPDDDELSGGAIAGIVIAVIVIIIAVIAGIYYKLKQKSEGGETERIKMASVKQA